MQTMFNVRFLNGPRWHAWCCDITSGHCRPSKFFEKKTAFRTITEWCERLLKGADVNEMGVEDYAGTIVSCIGVVFLLAALTGSQTGLLRGDTVMSLTMNAIGGTLATIGASLDGVWAFVVLNGIWALLSTFNLLRKQTIKTGELQTIKTGEENDHKSDVVRPADQRSAPSSDC